MALAKKGSRVLVVDGQRYRWTSQAPYNPNYVPDQVSRLIVIQEAEGRGQKLVVTLADELGVRYDADGGVEVVGTPTAAVVRGAILFALDFGWQPLTPGPDANMGYRAGQFIRGVRRRSRRPTR
jgi:hypothetical protein